MKTPTPHARRAGFRQASLAMLLSSISAVTAFAGPLDKNPVKNPNLDPIQEAHPMYLGTVTGGVKTSDVYTEGNFSIVAPVYSTLGADATLSGDVLYLEPYTSWGEGGEVAASLGLGWRHLFGSQPVSALTRKDAGQAGFLEEGVFIGANVFIDMLDTEANNQFWQLGVGVEIGTRYVEVRGNYYIPLSDKQLAEQQRTREVIQNSSTRQSNSTTPLSDPYATGNTVAQDALFTTRATTTTRTTTIDRLFRRYEEGMEGWDAEVAVLVPGLDKYFDLRLIGGYYSFDNQPFGAQTGGTGNVEGFKAGVEIRPVPAVILTGTWYEDDRLTGSDWTAGIQLQLPFEMGDIGDGKGFWGRIGDSFKPRRRHLAERMAEPVHRQNAAIKIANSVDVDTTTSTKVKRVTKVVSQRQGQIILADDIIFVNNGSAVGNGIQEGTSESNGADGTAEHPFDTITEGAFVAGNNSNSTTRLWSVYTQGNTGNLYKDSFDTTGSTRFISSFTPIAGLNGTKFGGNTERPFWNGAVHAEDVDTLIVRGYTLFGEGFGGFGSLIEAYDVKNVVISDNIVGFTPDAAIYVEATQNADYYTLISNNIAGLATSAVEVELRDDARMHLDLVDNQLYVIGDSVGARLVTFGDSVLTANVSGNRFVGLDFGGAGTGLLIEGNSDGLLTANVFNNDFEGVFEGRGAYVRALNGGSVAFNFIGNRFSGSGFMEDGVDLYADDSTLNAVIANNRFAGDFGDSAVAFYLNGSSQGTLQVQDNRFGGFVADEAIDLYTSDQSQLIATISGNNFPGEFDQLLVGEKYNQSILDITFTNNVLNGDYNESAIELNGYNGNTNGSKLVAVIGDNLFNGDFAGLAIDVDKLNNALVDITIRDNRFQGEFEDDTINLYTAGGEGPNNRMIATITGNQFRGIHNTDGGFAAISLESHNDSKLDAVITSNIFEGNFGDDLIEMYSTDESRVQATISDNRVRNVAIVDGSFINAYAEIDSNIVVQDFNRNLVRGSVFSGLTLQEVG
ncbi:MAG TPA: inverse autotransporter beta domain-containing protein, partial [Roseimicrobium sp.]|nr:inverse autotransporter beta domain-containing protein [Roseimicrobium sp.]